MIELGQLLLDFKYMCIRIYMGWIEMDIKTGVICSENKMNRKKKKANNPTLTTTVNVIDIS